MEAIFIKVNEMQKEAKGVPPPQFSTVFHRT